MTSGATTLSDACPCGSGSCYAACCEPLIRGTSEPATAEALMRSRYSAYVMGEADYLRHTWHPATRPASLVPDAGQRWLGLKIRATEAGGTNDDEGVVEFVARYKIDGRGFRLHERSRFTRLDGRWVYLDGEQMNN